MRNFKRYISFAAIIALLFTSCSKDEQSGIESEKATLTFGAIVNDLVANRAADRQAEADLPECTDDVPAYVRIVLMQGETEVVGSSGNPYRIDLVSGQIYTEDDPALELEPGIYSLDHLSVYNSEGDLIWIAPRVGSGMGEYVDYPLPLAIDLRAGVKKYVDVSVVCFDDRDVNEYGYLFFELDTNIALTYCFFANYCNEDGRHFPAQYSISIWSGTTSAGMLLYSNEENTVGQYDNGDYFATPLCFAVPDNTNMDTPYLYYEVTLLDWADVYGDVEQPVLSGTITKRMITDNFGDEDDTDYHHLKFNCGDDDEEPPVDSDGDGVPDSIDECPGTASGVDVDEVGCPDTTPCDQTAPEADCDNDGTLNKCDEDNPNWSTFDCDGDLFLNGVDSCPDVAGVAGGTGGDGCPITNGCDQTAPEADCDNDGTLNKCDEDNPNWATFDCDGDGFLNGVDSCPDVAGVAGGVGGDGCPDGTDPCANLDPVCSIPQTNAGENCYFVYFDFSNPDDFVQVTGPVELTLKNTFNEVFGKVNTSISNGDVLVSIDGSLNTDRVIAYEVEVRPGIDGAMSNTCWESLCNADVTIIIVDNDQTVIDMVFNDFDYTYPYYLRIKAIICQTPL